MSIQFLIRKTPDVSPFREALSCLLSTQGDELILSTGYMSEALLNSYNIGDFLNKIIRGFTINGIRISNAHITIIGGMFNGDNPEVNILAFETIIKTLKRFFPVTYYKPYNNNWHGKIALKSKDSCPLISIIGSSNLTSPCFSLSNPDTGFIPQINMESDLLIWNGTLLKNFKGISSKYVDNKSIVAYKNILIHSIRRELLNFDIKLSIDELKVLAENPPNLFLSIKNMLLNYNANETINSIWTICLTLLRCNSSISVTNDRIYFTDILPMRASSISLEYILNDINDEIRLVKQMCEEIPSNVINDGWHIFS